MLTVEQVRNLDEKVRKAVDLIDTLKKENSTLKDRLDNYRQRVDQLESVVDGFKQDQIEIEQGIKDVLSQLDHLEDQITLPSSASPPEPVNDESGSDSNSEIESDKPPELEIF
jgi:chromosome segregation ATPase